MGKDRQAVQWARGKLWGQGKGGVVTKGERLMCAQGPTMEVACFRASVSAVEE